MQYGAPDLIWLPLDDIPINHVKTNRNEGIGGFYKGLGPSLLRVVPASAITFLVYEESLNFCRTRFKGQPVSGG